MAREAGTARRRDGTGGRWNRRLFRAAALAGCWALLLQVVIPLVHVPPARAATEVNPATGAIPATGGIPAWVLAALCQAGRPGAGPAGTAVATVAPGGEQGAAPVGAPVTDRAACPICFGLHLAGTFAAPVPLELPRPAVAGAARFVPALQAGCRPQPLGTAKARGPPPIA